jgi:hypothetical protein
MARAIDPSLPEGCRDPITHRDATDSVAHRDHIASAIGQGN